MRKKISLIMAVSILLCSCSTTNTEPQKENINNNTNLTQKKKTQAERINEKILKYVDVLGNPKILYLATVQNTDTRPLEFGNTTIDIKNNNGEILKHVDMASIYPTYIMPGEYGYICEECTQLDSSVNLDDVSSAEMHFGTRLANYTKPNVELTELKIVKTSYSWEIIGKIKANEDIDDLFIALPVFDSNKELQTVALANIEGLMSGNERGFKGSFIEYDPSTDFSSSTVEAIPYILR